MDAERWARRGPRERDQPYMCPPRGLHARRVVGCVCTWRGSPCALPLHEGCQRGSLRDDSELSGLGGTLYGASAASTGKQRHAVAGWLLVPRLLFDSLGVTVREKRVGCLIQSYIELHDLTLVDSRLHERGFAMSKLRYELTTNQQRLPVSSRKKLLPDCARNLKSVHSPFRKLMFNLHGA